MSIFTLLEFLYILKIMPTSHIQNNKININQMRALDSTTNIYRYNITNKEKTIIVGNDGYSFSSNTIDENGQLFIQSSKDDIEERYVFALMNNGRQYFNDNYLNIFHFQQKISSDIGNSIVLNSNNEKYLFSIINGQNNFELLDLSSTNMNNSIYIKSSSLIPESLNIDSYVNSLFKLKDEENKFIFAYCNMYYIIPKIYIYRIILFKGSFSVTSGNLVYNIVIQKTYDSSFSYILSCFETTNYINCLYTNALGFIILSVLDKNLENKISFYMEKIARAYNHNNFRKGIFLKNETCVFVYYENNDQKPILILYSLTYDEKNGYKLNIPISIYLNLEENLISNCDLNDIIKIHDNRFSLVSALLNKKSVAIFLFDLYNNDKTLTLRQYIFNLNGYDIYSNLRLFVFRNFLGFSNCYGTKENCAFRILNYGNTTDFEKIEDFLLQLDLVNPLNLWNNIEIENNLFDYELTGIKIISIPDNEKTGLSIIRTRNLKEIEANDTIKNSLIIFSYIANKTITNGDYMIEFAPIVSEKSYEEFNKKANVYIFGEKIEQKSEFKSLDYIGRYGQFSFNLQNHSDFKCHRNCFSCYKSYLSDNEQFCIKCIDNYFFIENTQNCFKEPIGYFFKNDKKVYSSCHPLCRKCISKELNDSYMNCLSCKNEYKLYPKTKNCLNCPKYVNFEQTECSNEIPPGFYLYDSELGIIEKCHPFCSICSIGPSPDSMNCDYCIEGYYLKIDKMNNKNCFQNNEIIEDNYFQKDIDKKIFYECYDLCGSCDNFGNSTNMNCLTCISKYQYDEEGKYCFPYISCNNEFYYIFDENNFKSKICVPDDQFCPPFLPYELISTRECIIACSYEELTNLICKPSNNEAIAGQMKETFENQIETNDEMIEDVLNNEFEDITIFGKNSTYQITTSSNQEEQFNLNIKDAISNIDLGDCEKIIKKKNNIDENVSLIILKDDFKNNKTFSSQVEYEVINPITRKVLNLSSCKNTTIIINAPLDVDDKTFDLYVKANQQGYDIFDSESEFYKDVCTVYTSERGTDMILSDRRSDILNNTPKLCEDGCKYSGTNIQNKKVLCECIPKSIINTNFTNINFSLKFFEEIFFKFSGFNYKILGCFKLLYNKKNIINNYGFYIMSILLLSFFILIPINLSIGIYQLKLKCYKIIQDKQNLATKIQAQKDIKFINSKDKFMLSNNIKLKKSKTILGSNKFTIPKMAKKRTTKVNKNEIQQQKVSNERYSIKSDFLSINKSKNNNKKNLNINANANDNSQNFQRVKKQKTFDIRVFKNNKNQKIKNNRNGIKKYTLFKNGIINIIDSFKKSTDSIKALNSGILKKKDSEFANKLNNSINKNKNKDKKNMNNSFKKIFNKDDIISEKSENEEEQVEEKNEKFVYYENCIRNIPSEKRLKYFDEEELNQMEYQFAIKIDNRDFTQYYFSLLRTKQLILFTFFHSDDYNIYLVKISLFICSFSVYFMINTCFFNDKIMHKIYEENGSYNFIYQLPQIVYSALISSAINFIMKNLSLSQKGVIKIKQLNKINKMIFQTFSLIKNFRLKMIFFNILGFLILGFACYYITMFCTVYTNTQIHLLKDTFSSFSLSLLYPFGVYLVPGFFRIPSLKSSYKNKICLYKISQLASLI